MNVVEDQQETQHKYDDNFQHSTPRRYEHALGYGTTLRAESCEWSELSRVRWAEVVGERLGLGRVTYGST